MKKAKGKRGKMLLLGVILTVLLVGSTAYAYMYPVELVWRGGEKIEEIESSISKTIAKKTVYSLTDPYEHHNSARVCVRLGSDIARSTYGNQGLYVELSETKEFPWYSLGPRAGDFSPGQWWFEVR